MKFIKKWGRIFLFCSILNLLTIGIVLGESAPENGVVVVSSTTYSTVVWEYETREVYLGNPDSLINVFYRIDGSTTNITTEGWWLPAGQGQMIEYKGDIYLQLEAGESDVTLRKMIIRE